MLASPPDFGYAPATQLQHGYEQSGERPKLFAMEQQHPQYAYHPGAMMTNADGTPAHHAAMTPQHQHPQYDHEPLMMNMQNASAHYYPQMQNAQLLHVATDYTPQSMASTTPSSTRSLSGTKRSREELNLKEKKRMFKLNDRINQLKTLLDDAGVQCKKNKQSILDNTFHYIGMLRSNLMIAKQKAERAEKQASALSAQGGAAKKDPMAELLTRCFQQSTMARAIVTANLEPVAFNQAFLLQCGVREDSAAANLRSHLCEDDAQLDQVVERVLTTHKTITASVQAHTASGSVPMTLLAAPVSSGNEASYIEFSLVPHMKMENAALTP